MTGVASTFLVQDANNGTGGPMRKWIPLVFIVATALFSAVVYTRLPDPMVIHWNAAGEPNGYGSRAVGAFALPGLTLFLWALFLALPKLDPRREHIEQFRDSYDVLVIAVVAVTSLVHVGVLGSALGWPIQVGRLAPIAIGGLFIVLGAVLPKFRSNFFFGMRTPWTLSSETVWKKTHRLGGTLMMVAGALLIVAGVVGTARWLYVALGGAGSLILVVLFYSYLVWRSEPQH